MFQEMATRRNFALIASITITVTFLELVAYWNTNTETDISIMKSSRQNYLEGDDDHVFVRKLTTIPRGLHSDGSFTTTTLINTLNNLKKITSLERSISMEISTVSPASKITRSLPQIVSTPTTHTPSTENFEKTRRLTIHAGANCGSEGFRVDPKEKDRISLWAPGSIPFPERVQISDPEPSSFFFSKSDEHICYSKGTVLNATSSANPSCVCKTGYYGKDCGIPSAVWYSDGFSRLVPFLKRRETARRVVHGVTVNHELQLTEARMNELGDSVSVFLISESDFTAAGERKDRLFDKRARLNPSFLAPFRSRTLLLRMDHFPPEGCNDGWVADTYLRTFLGKEGLSRVDGLSSDDLFLLLDGDEIPKREVIDFLRLYEGYSEPIDFTLRWFVYGFFWEKMLQGGRFADTTRIEVACTIGMLQDVYGGDPVKIRRRMWEKNSDVAQKARRYEESTGRTVGTFMIGELEHPAGFHCSWCFNNVEDLQVKLVSAQLADGPRWGDYWEKIDPEYLKMIVRNGEWFDGGRHFIARDLMDVLRQGKDEALEFAPRYMLERFDEFFHILVHPSKWNNGELLDEYRRVIRDIFNVTEVTLRPAASGG